MDQYKLVSLIKSIGLERLNENKLNFKDRYRGRVKNKLAQEGKKTTPKCANADLNMEPSLDSINQTR